MGVTGKVLRRHLLSLVAAALGILVLAGWWNSSRYSERHLIYLDRWTVEVFSASSLIRLSLVNGRVGNLGQRTFYRHPNARGKFMIRPMIPTAQRHADMIHLTFGYWHLFGFCLVGGLIAIAWEWRSIRACREEAES